LHLYYTIGHPNKHEKLPVFASPIRLGRLVAESVRWQRQKLFPAFIINLVTSLSAPLIPADERFAVPETILLCIPTVYRLLSEMQSNQVHGKPMSDPEDAHVYTREYAASLDRQDPLHHIRKEFLIPSKAHLKSTALVTQGQSVLTSYPNGGLTEKGQKMGCQMIHACTFAGIP